MVLKPRITIFSDRLNSIFDYILPLRVEYGCFNLQTDIFLG